MAGNGKDISPIMFSIKKTKRDDDGYLTEKRQKITFSTTLKRLGGDWGLLLGDEMLQRSFNMKPLNETELEKVAKPDTRYKREEEVPSA